MKMKPCPHAKECTNMLEGNFCEHSVEHERDSLCDLVASDNACPPGYKCAPVKPKRKTVTAWRVHVDCVSRSNARMMAIEMRRIFPQIGVRGPVKVVLP